MPEISFYFDYRSPYSYLALSQIEELDVDYRPFDIPSLMEQAGNVPTSVTCKAKNRYVQVDMRRWAERYRVPLQRHPDAARIDARRLLRATLAAGERGRMAEAVALIFGAMWARSEPMATAAEIAAVLSAAGLDRAEMEAAMDDPALDRALDVATSAAVERGVFGAPTMFVGNEMYFGNDRLSFLQERLRPAA